ncbi:MAG: peptidylprolyl isomerase [Comamonadaceae bacterium]|jgi:FKBP-type peptidyl-prolyl cis-trans isomerase SlyD|uniref:FKBP-type peptidyl-prolyl cis-trans isomerase n=1 Tax=Candidatus Skiveiella danica TaxID=3386177 RepID=UPI00390B7EFA|nr:peptidylprolyl isomerase [Comamonadaceae bacterium]MBK9986671.1 peptidylprolyl isomerase [Betaproteobacteria bacterium]MBK6928818.1 peptidylprolyl isomerase [Comamonadaceae bacterium]MBK7121222.1 peptidylprolyl isomerase [Comamonadaceae bacterium]MBK7507865.1 peptidylprolyl isomerase [Comamonadaceae bacterium]
MKISANTVVTLDYEVKDPQHEMVDPGERPLVYLHGSSGIFPKLEAALDGKTVGDSVQVQLEPEDAFGEYDDELVTSELLQNLPEGVLVGMQLEGTGEHGTHIMSVTEIEDGRAVLDGNHPLAGVTLVFSCTVSEVRAATAEELAHGHAHGDGGHQH